MKTNYLQTPMFKVNVKKQLAKRKQFSKDLKSKNFKKKTKILEYANKFI